MRLRTTTALAALVAAGVTPLTLTAPAAAATATYTDDFNGDGYRDVATGAACSNVGDVSCAGVVVVLYGSSSGLTAAKKTVISQKSTGVPGTPEAGDLFGSSLASGDLDRDGYADLVVGASGESIGDRDGVGSATVLWGGKSGLSGGATLPQPSSLAEYGGFGQGAATGDFDGDGATDVTLTGQSQTRLYEGPFTRTGTPAIHTSVNAGSTYEVAAGDLNGDGAAERLYPHLVDGDPGGQVNYWRWTGMKYTRTTLPGADGLQGSVADIDGDGYGDLVLGDYVDPSTDKPTGHLGGRISVWYGGPDGPDPAQQPTVIHQDSPDVPGAGEAYDGFGASVSTGDINKDGYADVAVGAPGEALGSAKNAGMVTVLFGSASGLTTKGAKNYTQNTAGVPGTAETWDRFGSAVRLVDLTKDGRAELVIGVDGENNTGGIWSLRATSTGLTTTGAVDLTANALSVKDAADLGRAIAQ